MSDSDAVLLCLCDDSDIEISFLIDENGRERIRFKALNKTITLAPEEWFALGTMYEARPTSLVEDFLELGDMVTRRIMKHGIA